ncbi:MAG: small subunit ribosomal protein S9 [Microgenomates group bacterium Gr01-1014_7]|nr:MAG: small subunit ribosomal protein S9 [Microgenomates group bacterium Gr01-1014_7]
MPDSAKSQAITTVGRRKEAVARVRVTTGNGQIIINGKPIAEYFLGSILQKIYSKPLEITKTVGKYSISVKVEGGGRVAQLGAVIHGISRALIKADPSLKVTLKKAGFLTRDPRVKERRKFGHAQKARAMKQSPKR